jgi:hypothetical protein
MKKLIKKILKEDLDWINDVDPIKNYVSWLNHKFRQSWQYDFEDAIDSFGYCSGDAGRMLELARIWEDQSEDPKKRFNALDEFESYAMIGTIIENNKLYYRYVVQYSHDSGLPEDVIQEIAERMIQEGIHKKKFNR